MTEIELVDTEGIVTAASDSRCKRADVAALYAVALRYNLGQVDWAAANEAIISRWSLTGLHWIKARAWKAIEAAGY